MSRRIGVRHLQAILHALASSPGMVPDPDDRAALTAAVAVLNRQERPVEVIVVAPDADPIVDEVLQVVDRIDNLYDELHAVRDHVDDVLRLLRKDRAQPAGERS